MPDVSRVFCVAFPFLATLAALLTLLVATLGGKHVNSVYMFTVDLTDLSIDPRGLDGILDGLKDTVTNAIPTEVSGLESLPTDVGDLGDLDDDVRDRIEDITGKSAFVSTHPSPDDVKVNARSSAMNTRDIIDDILNNNNNISASDLGLQNIYKVNLWGTCHGPTTYDTTCSDPQFDWASQMLNTTWLENIGKSMGANITLPDQIKNGLTAFNTSIKWLEIVFIVALVLLAIELFFGLWSSCSRIWSCLAYVVAGIATTVLIVAAIFATAVIATVIAGLKASAKIYGADASFNTSFLALIWISAAFALTAGLFWCFSACCCANKREHKPRGVNEKHYSSSSYAPLGSNAAGPAYGQNERGAHAQSGAYEPYSHRV